MIVDAIRQLGRIFADHQLNFGRPPPQRIEQQMGHRPNLLQKQQHRKQYNAQ